MAELQQIKTGSSTWGEEATKINTNFQQLNQKKVEHEEGKFLMTQEERDKLGTLQNQVQSDLEVTDETSPSFIKGKEPFKGIIGKQTDVKIALSEGNFITPTLDRIPTSATLTYKVSNVEYSFRIGQSCRVIINGEPTFYKLTNISSNTAVWKKEGDSGGGGGTSEVANEVYWYELQNPATIIPLTGIAFNQPSVSYLFKEEEGSITGDTLEIANLLTYEPANASDTDVHFTTNNPDLVVKDGVITKLPNIDGTYTITATSVSGGFVATLDVNVSMYIRVESISFKETQYQFDKNAGVIQLMDMITILPNNATNKGVEWEAFTTGVLNIDPVNNTATPLINGTTNLKVTSKDSSEITAGTSIIVYTTPTSLTLNKSVLELAVVGDVGSSEQLIATILPPDASVYTNITWTAFNDEGRTEEEVGSPLPFFVDNNGLVTARFEGIGQVYAELEGHPKGIGAGCDIVVKKYN